MHSISSGHPTNERLRGELWAWAAWLVLCVVSYPVAVVIWTAPRAGLAAAVVVGGLLVVMAGAGYTGRGYLDAWWRPLLLGAGAALGVGVLATLADDASAVGAAACGAVVGAAVIFIWQFLPWLVRDAESEGGGAGMRVQLLGRRAAGALSVRAALGLLLVLSFLALGLGASWVKGGRSIPSPVPWLVAVICFSLALMFLERLVFFERSAREGNLLLASGSFRVWAGAGLAILVLAALLATAVPWRPPPEGAEAAMTDGRSLPQPHPPRTGEGRLREALSAVGNSGRSMLTAISAAPGGLLALWLLLLLLLAALILVWGFRRTRAAHLLFRAVAWLIGPLLRAWHRVWRALKRLLAQAELASETGLPSETGISVDPLFDIFDHAEALLGVPPREVVIRTYHLLLNYAEMLGISRRAGHTAFEHAHVLARAAPESAESIHTLTWAYASAMYGGEAATIPDLSSVRETWTRIRQRLIAGLSPEELNARRRAYLAAGSMPTPS